MCVPAPAGGGNRFDPDGAATRAQVTVILMRYTSQTQEPAPDPEPTPDPEPAPEDGTDVLVAYFSAAGNAENIAQHLQAILDADLYEIVPEVPYTSEDLNYSNDDCRANQEQNDPDARPAIDGSVDSMEDYAVIFLGYPIWWGEAPKIISTFLESYDFGGKSVVPFCTSGSSGIGSSARDVVDLAPGAAWLDGQRFRGSASRDAVAQWVDGLGLKVLSGQAGGFTAVLERAE